MGKIMTTIPQGAFERCNSLEMLTIPKGVTFYSVMLRLRLFLSKFSESHENECIIAPF